jgi:hypothetical protein
MEKNAIFNLRVNTGASDADINKTTKATEGLTKATKDANKENQSFESRLSSLNDQVKAGDFSMREASKLIQEYASIANQAGKDSPVGREAIARAAELQDQMSKLRTEITNLSNDGKHLQGALQITQGTLGGFQAFQGVTALIGVENENLMKTMVKLQAVQQVSMGIESVRKTMEEGQAGRLLLINIQTKAAAAATVIYAGAQSALTFAIGTTTGALKLLRIALVATGLGAIVVGIGLVIANFDKLKDTIIGVIDSALKPLMKGLQMLGIIDSDETKQIKKNAEERSKAIQKENQKRRAEINLNIKQNENLQNSIIDTFDFEIAKARAAGKDTFELEKQKRAEYRKTLEEQIKLLEQSLIANAGNLGAQMDLLKQMAAARKAITKSEQEDEIATITKTTSLRKASTKSKIDNNKKAVDEAAKQLERERLLRDFFIASIEDDDVRSLTALQEKHKRELEELEKKYKGDGELKKQLEAQQLKESADAAAAIKKKQTDKETEDKKKEAAKELADERAGFELKILQLEKNSAEELAAKLELMEFEREQLLANDKLTANEKLLIEEKYQDDVDALKEEAAKRDKDLRIQERDAMIETFEDGLNSIQNLTDMVFSIKMRNLEKGSKEEERAARKQFQIQKAMQLGMAMINGAQSILAITSVPDFTLGVNTAIRIASQATLTAATMAKIATAKFGGTGGGPGPDIPAPPSPDVAPQMNMRDVSQGTNTQQQSTTMVAVLESDITNTQRRISDIEVRTTF